MKPKATKIPQMTREEKKIYKSILKHFPATSKLSAYGYAIEDGVKFDFRPT